MHLPLQVLHPHSGEGDHLAPKQKPDPMLAGPVMGTSLLGQWHAFKGRPIEDEMEMEFHRQLDHVAVWIDRWSHQQVGNLPRCTKYTCIHCENAHNLAMQCSQMKYVEMGLM